MLQTRGDSGSIPGPGSSPGEGNDNPLQYSWASLVAQMVKKKKKKNSACKAGALGLIPGMERCPRGGRGNPLQYSCLENPLDGAVWRATVRGVAKRHTVLSMCDACRWRTEASLRRSLLTRSTG